MELGLPPAPFPTQQRHPQLAQYLIEYMNVHPQEASAATASPHRYGVEKVLPRLFACVPQPRPAATSGGVGGGDGAGDAGGLDLSLIHI